MSDPNVREPRNWRQKFRDAGRGLQVGIRDQTSFLVHLPCAAAVVAAAALFGVSRIEWCLLLLCIAFVLTAELANSALEHLARAVTDEHDPRVADSLDTGSAAVLVASLGAVVVGLAIFLPRAASLAGW